VPESWIAPAHVLEARAIIRLYKDLLDERTAWLQRVHATLFHQGVPVIAKLTTPEGAARLAAADLSAAGRQAVAVGLRQIQRLTGEMARSASSLPTCRRGRWAAAPCARPTTGSGRSPRWRSGPSWAALLHLVGARHVDAEPSAQGSDRQGELVERDRHPLVHRLLDRELVGPRRRFCRWRPRSGGKVRRT
jgi:hypothetical protein